MWQSDVSLSAAAVTKIKASDSRTFIVIAD